MIFSSLASENRSGSPPERRTSRIAGVFSRYSNAASH